MSEPDRRGWITPIAMIAGFVITVAGTIASPETIDVLLHEYIRMFGFVPHDHPYHYLRTVLPLLPLSIIGIAFLFLSYWVDFDKHDGSDAVPMSIGVQFYLILMGLGFIWLHSWAAESMNNSPSGFGFFIAGIAVVILTIPAVIANMLIIPVMLMPFISGLICLPRILIYYTTRHPLLSAWQRNKGDLRITPTVIAGAMGHSSQSATQALKLKRDLERLEREITARHKELAQERENLRSTILGDAERFETEKRMSKLLIDIDTLNTEVEAYRQYVRQKGTGR